MRPRSIAPSRTWLRWPDISWTRSSPTRNPGTARAKLRAPAPERPNASGRHDRSVFRLRQIVAGSAVIQRAAPCRLRSDRQVPGLLDAVAPYFHRVSPTVAEAHLIRPVV